MEVPKSSKELLELGQELLGWTSPLFNYVVHPETRQNIDTFLNVSKMVSAMAGEPEIAIPIELAHLFMRTSASLYDAAKASKYHDYEKFYQHSNNFARYLAELSTKVYKLYKEAKPEKLQ